MKLKKIKRGQNSLKFLWEILIILIIILLIFFIQNKSFTGKVIENEQKIKIMKDCGYDTALYNFGELCWQKSPAPEPAKNWNDANTYCKNLILANYSNWRLPNLDELKGIKEYMKTNSSLFKERYFWTSTSGKTENFHYYIAFGPSYYYQGYAGDFRSGYGIKCIRENIY